MRITVTVTLDGRLLIMQGRNTIELVTPRETAEVLDAMREAHALQGDIWPAQPPTQSTLT